MQENNRYREEEKELEEKNEVENENLEKTKVEEDEVETEKDEIDQELKKDSTMHAEIIAIRRASKKIGDWRLNECVMYVTMEPCIMCLGAIKESRIKKIYCGVKNKTYNEVNKKIIDTYNLNVEYGILKLEIQKQLKSFFKIIRNK